ncbi:hypothetical protein [Actinomadura violacea]|uniref:Uncharacterized protein n=1 Tax=Actinomadura violacea TaxID=2819934 RepID=A0ABS3S813_9ACTN|nr:hypothetical protein [Actinomadura violacea]MBO2465021.1 hypothetical protein [Actinomadura violacea]
MARRTANLDAEAYDYVGASAVARRIRDRFAEPRQAAFEVIEFEELDHIAGPAEAHVVTPQLTAVGLPGSARHPYSS